MTSREFRDRLGKRARKADVAVTPALVDQLEAYYRLLVRWNNKINLTALRLTELNDTAIDRLLIEPLVAARHVPDKEIRWFDFGSGGGSPALPLKIARQLANVVLVESKTRKAAFLREAVRALELSGAEVQNVRFEELLDQRDVLGTAELVTVRAVKLDRAVFDAAAALLRRDGRLFLFRSEELPLTLSPPFALEQTVRSTGGPSSRLIILTRNG